MYAISFNSSSASLQDMGALQEARFQDESFDARRNIFPRRDSPMMDSPHLANMINH